MTFERDLDISGDLEQFVKEERDSLALKIDQRVVKQTPVDTGAARRNWLVSFNRANTSQIAGGTADEAISQGQKAIKAAGAYGNLFIQNNLPYINRLNEGWSEQAPSKYVDAIIIQEVSR